MSKKKILTIALCVALVAALVIGGSIAYFTDTKEATNTFTVGGVKIELNEWGKDEDGKFVAFESNDALKELAPGFSNSTLVQKLAFITNTGKSDAWVWAEILIPAQLVSLNAEVNEENMALHYNTYANFHPNWFGTKPATPYGDGVTNEAGTAITFDDTHEYVDASAATNAWTLPARQTNTVTIDGVEYVVFLTKMQSALPAGKTSLPFLRGAYMDNDVDYLRTEGEGTAAKDIYAIPYQQLDNTVQTVEYSGSWEIIVRAYAIQVPGFDSVDAAYAAFPRG